MNHNQNANQGRAAIHVHRKKIALSRRAAGDDVPGGTDITTPGATGGATGATTPGATTPVTSKTTPSTVADTSKTTDITKATSPSVQPTSSSTPTTSSATTPLTSSVPTTTSLTTTSSTSVQSTPTTSIPTTSSTLSSSKVTVPTTTSDTATNTSHTSVFYTVTRSGTTTGSTVSASATSSSSSSGALNTGALVGGIGGGIVGIAVLCFVVAFIIRRFRRRSSEREAFDPSNFRRSAVLLDDEPTTEGDPFSTRRPRPPTMIERHVAHTPNMGGVGAASYGATQYGAPGQYQQQQQYPVYGQPQQVSFNPGEIIDHSAGYNAQANPFVPSHDARAVSPQESANAHTGYVSRQPSGRSAENHQAQGAYVDMNRVPAAAGKKRPDTVYDEEDAYGGM